jgi:hypothetical protein
MNIRKNNMIKRIIVPLISCISCLNIHAQGYESNIKARFDAGVDSYNNHSFGIEYIGGYRINPYVRIGAGTGLSYVNQLYIESIPHFSPWGTYDEHDEYKEAAAFVPLFVNGKFNFISAGVSPFLNLNVGYSFFIPFSEYAKMNHHSVFINPSFGIDVPLSSCSLTFEVGYKYQVRQIDGNALVDESNANYSQIEISVGCQF